MSKVTFSQLKVAANEIQVSNKVIYRIIILVLVALSLVTFIHDTGVTLTMYPGVAPRAIGSAVLFVSYVAPVSIIGAIVLVIVSYFKDAINYARSSESVIEE